MDQPELPTDLTITLPRETWSLLVYLTNQAARQAMDDFISKRMHTVNCLSGFAAAAVALQDAYKAQVPDAAKVLANHVVDQEVANATSPLSDSEGAEDGGAEPDLHPGRRKVN